MSNIEVCEKMCSDCPFSRKSLRGFLADYTVEDFVRFVGADFMFPCHKLVQEDMEADKVTELVVSGELKLCRGYVELLVRSCKLPRDERLHSVMLGISGALSDDSMSLIEFVGHHKMETN